MDLRKTHDIKHLLTPDEAARFSGVASARTFSKWARDGQIAHIKLPNGRVRFRREDIEEMMIPVVAESEGGVSDDPHLF